MLRQGVKLAIGIGLSLPPFYLFCWPHLTEDLPAQLLSGWVSDVMPLCPIYFWFLLIWKSGSTKPGWRLEIQMGCIVCEFPHHRIIRSSSFSLRAYWSMLVEPEAKWKCPSIPKFAPTEHPKVNFICTSIVLKVGKLTLCCVFFSKILSSVLHRRWSALVYWLFFHPSSLVQILRVNLFFKGGKCLHWTTMWQFYWYRKATFQFRIHAVWLQ